MKLDRGAALVAEVRRRTAGTTFHAESMTGDPQDMQTLVLAAALADELERFIARADIRVVTGWRRSPECSCADFPDFPCPRHPKPEELV